MKRALALITVALGSVVTVGAVSTPATATERPAVVDDAQIELAKLGVTLFSLDHLTEPASECPAVRADEVGYWMGLLGMAGTSQGYQVNPFSPDDVDALAIFCGVNPNDFVQTPDPAAPFALGLEVYNLLEGATFAQLLTTMSSPATPTPTPDPALGGEVATWCGTPGQVVCLSFWHRNGLVLDVLLVGPASGLDETKAQQLLLSMVDNAVTNLAAYGSGSGTATTVAPVTPTVAPTVPVPTVAPVTPTVAPVPPTVAPVTPTVPVPDGRAGDADGARPDGRAGDADGRAGADDSRLHRARPDGVDRSRRADDPAGRVRTGQRRQRHDLRRHPVDVDRRRDRGPPARRWHDDTAAPRQHRPRILRGVIQRARIHHHHRRADPDPQAFLTSGGLSGGCASFTTEPYDDGVFVGFVQIGTSCGTSGSWRMIVGNTVDGATGVVIQLQTASPADQVAVDTALSTLVLS